MPYTHSFLVRSNGHRILISDVQLLQWYARRRDIRRNPLPYATVKDAVMDLLANRETTVQLDSNTQLLITPAIDSDGSPTDPPTPAVIQHAINIPTPPPPTQASTPRTALFLTGSPQELPSAPASHFTNPTIYATLPPHSATSWTKKIPSLHFRLRQRRQPL